MAGASAAMLPVLASIPVPAAAQSQSPSLAMVKTEAQDAYMTIRPYLGLTSQTPAEALAISDYQKGEGLYSTDTNLAQAQADFKKVYSDLGLSLPPNF